ncbi:MAG: hypothetical protein GY835_10250 [bacterium]|nr:hypothetical protein [bacterium]
MHRNIVPWIAVFSVLVLLSMVVENRIYLVNSANAAISASRLAKNDCAVPDWQFGLWVSRSASRPAGGLQ